jgi:hypothetical protein
VFAAGCIEPFVDGAFGAGEELGGLAKTGALESRSNAIATAHLFTEPLSIAECGGTLRWGHSHCKAEKYADKVRASDGHFHWD